MASASPAPPLRPRVEQLISDLGRDIANATFLLRAALEDVAARDEALAALRAELRIEVEHIERLRAHLDALRPRLDPTEQTEVEALLREMDEERASRADEGGGR